MIVFFISLCNPQIAILAECGHTVCLETISKMWIRVQGPRKMRDFASDLYILKCSKGAGRFKSGANNSWLEATPAIFMLHIALYVLITKKHVGAASCRDM
jgi:hypothetical protein